MSQWGFYFDQSKCTFCHACEAACRVWNEARRADAGAHPLAQLTTGQAPEDAKPGWYYMKESLRRVTRLLEGDEPPNVRGFNLSLSCNHCTDPACVTACPTGRLYKEGERGLVLEDPEKRCVSCMRCRAACPWDAPQFCPDLSRPVMVKCDMCAGRLDEGRKPACVAACPMRALDAGPMEELKRRYPDSVREVRGFSANETGPNIIFKKRQSMCTNTTK